MSCCSAVNWKRYPVFVDTYYHMAVIEGFSQAGGITTHSFWEMAPPGRVHIYPPALHACGYLAGLTGVSARDFITFISWAFYCGSFLTTWLWMKQLAGPRSALFALVLLCGPTAFFFNQAAHTANAAVLCLAPLAFLALEREKYLCCGVVNCIVINLHPIGLFLPPALVFMTLVRRKRIAAGLLAAAVPVVLYLPWIAHVWANRGLLPENRTGGSMSLGGHGLNLGLLLAVSAFLAVPFFMFQRGRTLALLGMLFGFAVVVPMGFTEPGDVIFVAHAPAASLLTGVTGRWTSNGMLRDVLLSEKPPREQDCDYIASIGADRTRRRRGRLQGQGRRRRDGMRPAVLRDRAPSGFERVFSNRFGALYRNTVKPEHEREPSAPAVTLAMLLAVCASALLLVVIDFLPDYRFLKPVFVVPVCVVIVFVCLLPLIRASVAELQDPPKPHPEAKQHRPPFINGERKGSIGKKHPIVLKWVRACIQQGRNPDDVWPREYEERFRRLMQEKKLKEAERLLDNALEKIRESERLPFSPEPQ